jgi:serine/threonine protein kinase
VFLTLAVEAVTVGLLTLPTPVCDVLQIASSKDPPSIPDKLSCAAKDLALQCLRIDSELRPTAKELLHHICFGNWQTDGVR